MLVHAGCKSTAFMKLSLIFSAVALATAGLAARIARALVTRADELARAATRALEP